MFRAPRLKASHCPLPRPGVHHPPAGWGVSAQGQVDGRRANVALTGEDGAAAATGSADGGPGFTHSE